MHEKTLEKLRAYLASAKPQEVPGQEILRLELLARLRGTVVGVDAPLFGLAVSSLGWQCILADKDLFSLLDLEPVKEVFSTGKLASFLGGSIFTDCYADPSSEEKFIEKNQVIVFSQRTDGHIHSHVSFYLRVPGV